MLTQEINVFTVKDIMARLELQGFEINFAHIIVLWMSCPLFAFSYCVTSCSIGVSVNTIPDLEMIVGCPGWIGFITCMTWVYLVMPNG